MGVEPMNTGFAGEKNGLFSVTCGKHRSLLITERNRRESSPWVENGLAFGSSDRPALIVVGFLVC
jgi:hypothetical protein